MDLKWIMTLYLQVSVFHYEYTTNESSSKMNPLIHTLNSIDFIFMFVHLSMEFK